MKNNTNNTLYAMQKHTIKIDNNANTIKSVYDISHMRHNHSRTRSFIILGILLGICFAILQLLIYGIISLVQSYNIIANILHAINGFIIFFVLYLIGGRTISNLFKRNPRVWCHLTFLICIIFLVHHLIEYDFPFFFSYYNFIYFLRYILNSYICQKL